jgi:hypothetical protein
MIFQEMSWIFMNFHDLSALRILAVMEKSCSTHAESVFHEGSLVYMCFDT